MSVGTLSGCSGGDGSAYCDHLRDNAKSNSFDDLDASNPDDRKKMVAEAKKLRDEAPEEVRDDYDVVVSVLEGNKSDASKIQAANKEIKSYAEDTCDLEYEG
ncbi:MAG: hypothetical protein ACRDP4_04575 [Nocardioidaceae bacterium]